MLFDKMNFLKCNTWITGQGRCSQTFSIAFISTTPKKLVLLINVLTEGWGGVCARPLTSLFPSLHLSCWDTSEPQEVQSWPDSQNLFFPLSLSPFILFINEKTKTHEMFSKGYRGQTVVHNCVSTTGIRTGQECTD